MFKHILPQTLTGSSLSANTVNIKRFSDLCDLSLRSHPTQHCKRPRSLHTVLAHTRCRSQGCAGYWAPLTGLLRTPAAVSVITTRRRTHSENFFLLLSNLLVAVKAELLLFDIYLFLWAVFFFFFRKYLFKKVLIIRDTTGHVQKEGFREAPPAF